MTTGIEVATMQWSPAGGATVLACSGATHVGAVRSHNEDALLVGPPVFVVADGIGGHAYGDVASASVADAFAPLAGRSGLGLADVEEALARARAAVAAATPVGHGAPEPGATMVCAVHTVLAGCDYWLIAHVGDSRAYVWSADGLEQITRDHSVVQELIDTGRLNADEAATHPQRHVITRAISTLSNGEADFSLVPVRYGQRLLLCSDGLTGEVSERALAMLLAHAEAPEQAANDLIEAAVNMGGHDNVTVIVIDVLAVGAHAPFEATVPHPRGVR